MSPYDPQSQSTPAAASPSSTPDSSGGNSGNNNDRCLREDVFECLSKNKESYRVILTPSHLILHNSKDPSRVERYWLEDIFGCHTLRHKRQGEEPQHSAAYICFYLYPRIKRKNIVSSVKYREKLTLVFKVNKGGHLYEENLKMAVDWKKMTLEILARKYPKWNEGGGGGISSGKEIIGSPMDEYYLNYFRRYALILNPKSGQGKGLEILKHKVAPIFREASIKMELLITRYAGHAKEMATTMDLSRVDGIVCIGGDGILYEIVNGLRSREDFSSSVNIPVGIIAGGSGNGMARSLAEYSGESTDYMQNPILSTTLAVARGKVIQVNLAEVDVGDQKIYSFLSVGWGLMADIDVESESLRMLGESRFTLWSFYRLCKLETYSAKLSYVPLFDKNAGGKEIVDGNFVCIYSVCQSYIGTDLQFAPDSQPNDGVIHLCYIPGDVGRLRATQFLICLDKGKHLDVDGVKYIPVKEFTIERDQGIDGNLTIDGEKVTGNKIHVKLSPVPLNLFSL